MSAVISTLYACAHCKETGTCATGSQGSTCRVCMKANEMKGGHHGLPCGVRGGMGKVEPQTERLNKRMAPVLAYVMMILLLLGIALAAIFERHFSEVLAFAGTIIGVITGYYFSKKD